MPRRILSVVALLATAAFAVWGCQEYNFNPVGSCIIQPGQQQVTLSNITTADILFVVDDSTSTESKQQALAQNFSSFIDSLANAQKARVASNLEPFDFHIAVTTSSIFAYDDFGFKTAYPSSFPAGCTPGTAVASARYPQGDFVRYGTNPYVIHFDKNVAWSVWGAGVGAWLANHAYAVGNQVINAGNAYQCITAGTSAASGGPTGTTADITDGTAHWKYLGVDPVPPVQAFVGTCNTPAGLCSAACTGTCSGGNIEVGSCGSGQEQHFEAARLAVQKALGLGSQPPQPAPGEWPHPNSKMVVVIVGDEDDCSNPANYALQTAAVKMTGPAAYVPGADSCVADKCMGNPASSCSATPPPPPRVYPDGQAEYPISGPDGYLAFFTGLGRPLGAAFITSANRCTVPNTYGDVCAPADFSYVQSPASCTGAAQNACSVAYAGGIRHLALAKGLKTAGLEVVEGTVCESFGPILGQIADLVKPPNTLQLSSVPAANDVALLRIGDSKGSTVQVCTQRTATGPPPLTCRGTSTTCTTDANCGPGGTCGPYTAEGWWFVAYSASGCDPAPIPAVVASPTQCVFINHFAAGTTNSCEAGPGQTYSFEYLGRLPQGGCTPSTPTPAPSTSCAQALPLADGGASDPNGWWCYGSGVGAGTCVCSPRTP